MSQGSTTGTAESTGSGIQDVVSSIESLLDPPEEDTQGDDEAQADESEEGADEAADTEESEEQGAEDEADEADADPEADEGEEQQAAPADQKFTVKVDGKDTTVTREELIAGYSRQSDYTRKTQALANERKTFEQESAGVRQERAEYQALLPRLRKALEGWAGEEPNWAQLQAEDQANGTSKYANAWARWQQRQQSLAATQAEEARVAERARADQSKAHQKYLAEQQSQLIEKLPGWKDPEVARKESRQIADLMKSVGYSDDDISISDHRALIIARKAAMFDAIQAGRGKLREKLQKAPVVKPGGGKSVSTTKAQSDLKRLSQTGSVKDGAAVFENFL